MVVSKKDILAVIEAVGNEEGDSFVLRPKHKRYEVRAIRRLRGVDLKWALPGKFYHPSK